MNIGEIWYSGKIYYFIDKICPEFKVNDLGELTRETGIYFTILGDLSYSEKWVVPIERNGFCFLTTFQSFNLKKLN